MSDNFNELMDAFDILDVLKDELGSLNDKFMCGQWMS